MTTYLIISTILFLVLSFIWTKKDWLNFALKLVFFGMFCTSAFYLLTNLGFVVKIS